MKKAVAAREAARSREADLDTSAKGRRATAAWPTRSGFGPMCPHQAAAAEQRLADERVARQRAVEVSRAIVPLSYVRLSMKCIRTTPRGSAACSARTRRRGRAIASSTCRRHTAGNLWRRQSRRVYGSAYSGWRGALQGPTLLCISNSYASRYDFTLHLSLLTLADYNLTLIYSKYLN